VASSMTGFGEATTRRAGLQVRVEARSVNHKRLQVRCLLPAALADMEQAVEQAVRGKLARGSVTIVVRVQRRGTALEPSIRVEAARAVLRSARRLQRELGVKGDVDLTTLLSLPGVVQGGGPSDEPDDALRKVVLDGVRRALVGLVRHRAREGASMTRAMRGLVARLGKGLAQIERRAPLVVERYRERLRDRVQTAIADAGATVRPEDLVRDVALFADRSDVTEEITRLAGHLDHLRDALAGKGEVGRRVEFLLQEVLRETNTIGSKANDGELAGTVIAMKEDVEKLRELAANLE